MSKLLGCLLAIGLIGSALMPAAAQVRDEIATDRTQLQSDRQAIVAANLSLTDEQAKQFWPVYRDYRAEVQKLGDRMVDLLLDYAEHAESLSDAQAAALLDDFLAISKDEVKVKTAWVPKFRKVLSPKLVTRFYQIENKLDAMLRFDAVDRIPLVEDDPK